MPKIIPGRLVENGPTITLENFSSFQSDRLMFNGDQFVSFRTSSVEVSSVISGFAIGLDTSGEVVYGYEYDSYVDSSGVYRLVNGEPINDGWYSGTPGEYNYVLVGYSDQISTSSIKIWASEYIDPDLIFVDYGNDTSLMNNISGVSTSYIFDDTIKVNANESTPSGQYVYTISLGSEYSARYWRIRAFLYTFSTQVVTANIDGKTVLVSGTDDWPSSIDIGDETSYFYYHQPSVTYRAKIEATAYTGIPTFEDGESFTVYSLVSPELVWLTAGCTLDAIPAGTEIKVYGEVNEGQIGRHTLYEDIDISGGVGVLSSVKFRAVEGAILGDRYWVDFTQNYPQKRFFGYDSKTSTSFVSISGTSPSYDLNSGSCIVYSPGLELTQVKIGELSTSYFDYWFADGTFAGTQEFSIPYVYDVLYDVSDEVYYSISYSGDGNVSLDPSDDFSSGTGYAPSANSWSTAGNLIQYQSASGTLAAHHPSSQTSALEGEVKTLSYVSNDSFEAAVTAGFITVSGYCSFFVSDYDNSNLVSSVNFVGPYEIGDSSQSSCVYVSVSAIEDASNNTIILSNLSIDPVNVPEGTYEHKVSYVSGNWYYSRTVISGAASNVTDYLLGSGSSIWHSSFSVSVNTYGTPENNDYVTFQTEKIVYPNLSQSGMAIISLSGGVLSSEFSGAAIGSVQPNTTNYRFGISGKTLAQTYAYFDNFTLSGTTAVLDSPVFVVNSLDYTGDKTEAAGVSTEDGTVIGSLNIMDSVTATAGSYATTVNIGSTQSNPGSLFFKVGSDIYKYNKTDLPIAGSDDGSTAVRLSEGVIPSRDIECFGYDGYSNGGLSYVYASDSFGYYYLNHNSSNTLSGTGRNAVFDIQTSEGGTFVRDYSDLDVLYYIDTSNNAYLFDIDEDHVAFCSVSTNAPAMQASSGDSSNITAYVVNLYGDALQGRQVTFAVTQGDGSVTPALDCTTSSGTAGTTYYVGTATGVSIITATASNDTC